MIHHIAAAFVAAIALASPAPAADSKAPYSHVPAPGDSVRLDGSLGGATTAWAYADQHWLEEYLKVTIDAAAANKEYTQASGQLSHIAEHVTAIPNGTKASVETVVPFAYNGRLDIEIRVLVADGPSRGKEVWTTCAELVDSAGHRYVRT